jgi:hypothetical protein
MNCCKAMCDIGSAVADHLACYFLNKIFGSIKKWIILTKIDLLASALSILLLSGQPIPPRTITISLLTSGASGDDAGN